jgi:hypothetical protein
MREKIHKPKKNEPPHWAVFLFGQKSTLKDNIAYIKEVEKLIFIEMQIARNMMKKLEIKILNTDMNVKGIEVEYKVRGYMHNFYILRSLVKAELMTTLMNLGSRVCSLD